MRIWPTRLLRRCKGFDSRRPARGPGRDRAVGCFAGGIPKAPGTGAGRYGGRGARLSLPTRVVRSP